MDDDKLRSAADDRDSARKEERPREQRQGFKELPRDFIEKLALLVIGFALTTLAGGFLADQYRKQSARTALELASMQSDIARSVQVFESISQLMDKRLFRMRRLHDVFDGNIDPDASRQRLSDYRDVLVEWNDNLNRYRALYAFYFRPLPSHSSIQGVDDQSCAASFEAIAGSFTEAHYELQKLIDNKADASAKKVQELLDRLNVCVFVLDENMLSRISNLRNDYKARITNQ